MVEYLQEPYTIIERPLKWQLAGLRQTATGYGGKLTSERCIRLPDGRVRRIYITCYSNADSAWIILGGKRLYIQGVEP